MDIEKVKKLREETDISLGECRKALAEADGDLDKARQALAKRKKELAREKRGRETREGVIGSYIHTNKKVAALVDLRCETDFVAKSEDFRRLAHDLAMQVAAMDPRFVSSLSKDYLASKKKEWRQEFSEKPDRVLEEIIEGKVEKLKKETCLLNQVFIKREERTVKEVVNSFVAEFGENIRVERFVRYEIE